MPTPTIIPNKHTVLRQPFSFIAQQLRDTFSILMHICSFLYVIFLMLLFVKEQSNVTVKSGQVYAPRFY